MRARIAISQMVLAFLLVQPKSLMAQSTCGPIGYNDAETQLTVERSRRFYLNTANPAACNGTISIWTVCYYGPNSANSDSYWATYAVYRRNGSGEDERYVQVSRIFSAVRTNGIVARIADPEDGPIQEGGFVCYNDSTGDTPVAVQAGDIVGACIFNPDDAQLFNRRQLDIVGRTAGTGESLLELGESAAGCSRDSIPTEIQRSSLSVQNDRSLHLYANIAAIAPIEAPTTRTTVIPTIEVITTTTTASVTIADNQVGRDQESRVSLIVTVAGSASGALIIGILLSLMAVIAVIICLKRRQKTFQFTSNVAYTGQCTHKDIDYYAVSQPLTESVVSNVEMKDECSIIDDTAVNDSSKDQPLTMLYNTIDEAQLTIADVPKLNEEVLHGNIEALVDNQPSPVLYDTIEENTTEVLQSDSSPAALTVKEFPEIKTESELSLMTTENVAYNSSYPSSVNVEALQPNEEALPTINLTQNVAYKPTIVSLSPNIAYESHVHQSTENHDEYDYI